MKPGACEKGACPLRRIKLERWSVHTGALLAPCRDSMAACVTKTE